MPTTTTDRARRVHAGAIVVDTHADTPQRFLDEGFDFAGPLRGGDLNLESARRGNLAAEFFSIWVEPSTYASHPARRTLELIDAVQRQTARNPHRMALVVSAEGIRQARRAGRLAVLMGVEGGHSIENSLALLRLYYALGVRYLTLTWSNSNDWADSSGDIEDPKIRHTRRGLSKFGERVVVEMNRLGMMVDISHVADRTFYRTLEVSRAPLIASHSSARALCDHPRNMTDDMLRAIARSGGPGSRGGVVQVNFFSGFISQTYRDAWKAVESEVRRTVARAERKARAVGREFTYAERGRIRRGFVARIPRPPLSAVIDHIDHVVRVAGVDHVGLGSDFDGVSGQLPVGLETPAGLPKITEALLDRGYSANDCRKVLGGNLLRVFREVELRAERASRA